MTTHLDLADIQCNVVQDLGLGFPKARFIFLQISEHGTDAARAFLMDYRNKVTNALRWSDSSAYPGAVKVVKPPVAINLAITWDGLRMLGVPNRTLAAMPPEFIDGMAPRSHVLGDPLDSAGERPLNWDDAWSRGRVHILVALNAQMNPATGLPVDELQTETNALRTLCATHGLIIVDGHRNPDPSCQDATARILRVENGYVPTAKEHFGFTDGFGNPVFDGQFGADPDRYAVGGGKILPDGTWKPLATGEFLLGYPDEAQEVPGTAMPASLMRNGTFLIYRKLHQNLGSFQAYMDGAAAAYCKLQPAVSHADAREYLMAKMAGRWPDGTPLAKAPTLVAWRAFQKQFPLQSATIPQPYFDFRFEDDPDGFGCPMASHLRRVNPRDALDPVGGASSTLNNRRRLIRRGLPYGEHIDDDTSEHGVIFMVLCANIMRQFEFVQQQWLQYGLDSGVGNDDCPLLGARQGGDGKFVIPADPKENTAPFICADMPKFVEMRGGEYFFLPSMTALRMIGMGVVDPT